MAEGGKRKIIRRIGQLVSKQNTAQKNGARTKPRTGTSIKSPYSPPPDDKRNDDTKNALEWVKTVFTGLAVAVSALSYNVAQQAVTFTEKSTAASERSADAAQQSVTTAQNALSAVQRAFVFPRVGEIIALVDPDKPRAVGVQFHFELENSGSTPTKNMRVHMSSAYWPHPMPEEFNFHDEWEMSDLRVPGVLGPKATIGLLPIDVPADVIDAVARRERHLYFWGRVEYRDVFAGTPPHVTKFCYEMAGFVGDPLQTSSQLRTKPIIALCIKHNCYDEECQEQ